jgi:hypothetical protein
MVNINCLYLRLLFHKPYQSKENFFSQVGIHQIVVFGDENPSATLPLENLARESADNDY